MAVDAVIFVAMFLGFLLLLPHAFRDREPPE